MRAFAEGYYQNLISMYKYLGVQFHPQRFFYSFEEAAAKQASSGRSRECYFIYSSNNHRFLPIRPEGMSVFSWFIEIVYVTVCYFWWSLCCFWLPPMDATGSHLCESLDEYIKRIMLPRHFVSFYLLPLLSSVATCSHDALLQFPAIDLTEYKRKSAGGNHYRVSSLNQVQNTLGSGLEARFSTIVTKVEVLENGKLKVFWNKSDDITNEEIFDQVVLAVAPDIAGSLFQPLGKSMAQIPTTMVKSIVQGDGTKHAVNDATESGLAPKSARAAQTIHFRTSASLAQTESIHVYVSGAVVTTCPFTDISSEQNVLKSAKFLRALRTPHSRRVVNDIFGENPTSSLLDEKQSSWRNGDDNIWLVGGWCWDGMVLLEGCVVSAMRVASALDVDIPWRNL